MLFSFMKFRGRFLRIYCVLRKTGTQMQSIWTKGSIRCMNLLEWKIKSMKFLIFQLLLSFFYQIHSQPPPITHSTNFLFLFLPFSDTFFRFSLNKSTNSIYVHIWRYRLRLRLQLELWLRIPNTKNLKMPNGKLFIDRLQYKIV